MANISTGSTSIPFGTTLRIGYRINGSTSPFTYVVTHPQYDELPYIFTVPSAGEWEIEYTVICNSCSGNLYSTNYTTVVIV